MTQHRTLPTPEEAAALLAEAEARNPGPWADHSRNTALAAQLIAERCDDMDAQAAHTLGLLHDIGRYYGVAAMRHVVDGYRHMMERGYDWPARICLTHSFNLNDVECYTGARDCSAEDLDFLRRTLQEIVYDDYDRLIQLCDALADAEGFCLIEKRYVDVAIRHGIHPLVPPKWKVARETLQYFNAKTGGSVYRLLPGVVEGTFGFVPQPVTRED